MLTASSFEGTCMCWAQSNTMGDQGGGWEKGVRQTQKKKNESNEYSDIWESVGPRWKYQRWGVEILESRSKPEGECEDRVLEVWWEAEVRQVKRGGLPFVL